MSIENLIRKTIPFRTETNLQTLFLSTHFSTFASTAGQQPRIFHYPAYSCHEMVERNKPEIYRDYPRPPSPQCCARNILTVHRETLTEYITFKRGGEGSLYPGTLATVTSYIDASLRIVTKSPKVGPLYLCFPSRWNKFNGILQRLAALVYLCRIC